MWNDRVSWRGARKLESMSGGRGACFFQLFGTCGPNKTLNV